MPDEVQFTDDDPYSACLDRIDVALRQAMLQDKEMSQKEYDNLKAIRQECEAADDNFNWTVIP